MEFSFWNTEDRGRVALIEHDGTEHTAGALLDAGNQVAHQLAARGIGPGDVVAMCLHNEVAVYELYLAVMQMGVYLVPINWHCTAVEASYILEDCEAKAVFCSPEFADLVNHDGIAHRFCTGDVDGFEPFAGLRVGPTEPPSPRLSGGIMNYTSGTTGKPKGVKRPLPPCPPEPVTTGYASFLLMFGMQPGVGVQLVGSPLYHTAVLYFSTSALHLGHTVVLMKKWTPEGMLERIERYRVTASHMVPTQFSRMLALPNHREFDVSSVRHMVHGAAPCPNSVKEAMLEWWGDTVYEYYAATEGGGTMVTPQEWRARPGTVGKAWQTAEIAIFDDEGQRLGPDQVGTVYIKMQQSFEYYRDKEKTQKSYNTDGYFTVGDAGYLDDQGYLFLCDRKADMIISGGVNIYPAEIESVMTTHPNILDVAVFGIPDADWGEQVRAVVELKDAAQDDAESIKAWCVERIAKFKCPKTVQVIEAMPRDLNGKLRKRTLRDPFWEAHKAATGRSI